MKKTPSFCVQQFGEQQLLCSAGVGSFCHSEPGDRERERFAKHPGICRSSVLNACSSFSSLQVSTPCGAIGTL